MKKINSKSIFKSFAFLSVLLIYATGYGQTISGNVYFDPNNNGIYDGVDVELPAVVVELYIDSDNDNVADPGELTSSVTSSSTGSYSFTGVSGKAIVKVKSTSLGIGTALREEIIVLDGTSNTSANLFAIGQSPLCYAVADAGDDLVAFNRFDGTVTFIRDLSASPAIEALTINYDASLLYVIDADKFMKLNYIDGTQVGTTVQLGNITYKNASGGSTVYNVADADGIAIAGQNELWVSEVTAGGVIFKIDTNGNIINNVFGTGFDGIEVILPAPIASCSQLDDIAYNINTGKLYAIYNNGCANNYEYLVEIPTTGASAGIVTNYTVMKIGTTYWHDIEGLGYTTTGFLMGTTGANAIPSSQQEHVLVFEDVTMSLQSALQINYAGGGDFESCDCIAQKANPFVKLTISGTIYEDLDALNDNVVDGSPIQTVSGSQLYAYLADASGMAVFKDTIDASGNYSFPNALTYNAYEVIITTVNQSVGTIAPTSPTLPGTWAPTGETYGTNNAYGSGNESGTPNLRINVTTTNSNVTGVNLGLKQTNKISGTVWKDTDGDQVVDAGETERAQNVKVYVYDDADDDGILDAGEMTPLDSVYTDVNGLYEFSIDYISGTESYLTNIDTTTLPLGQLLTTDNLETISFTASGQTDANNNFGYKGDPNFINITGTVWKDSDEQGDIDAGETVRASDIIIRAYVDANTNGVIDANERTSFEEVNTDASGEYVFTLAYSSPITYLMEVNQRQLDGNLTTASVQSAAFTSGGNVDANNNFGYFLDTDELLMSGTVFNDVNENAVYGAGDTGTASIKVYMYRDTDIDGILDPSEATAIDSATTDAAGYFEFLKAYTCTSGAISNRVSASEDDGRELVSSGAMSLTNNELRLTENGKYINGVRFRNVSIPAGAVITDAYIQFTAKDNGAANSALTIHGEKDTNSAVFTTTDYNFSGKTLTTASAPWSVTAANWIKDNATESEQTSSLVDIVQEIVDQGGWSSGNAMSFFFSGYVGYNNAITYDQSTTTAPLLVVQYTLNCNDNYIFKVNPDDLPSGSLFTTDNKEVANFTNGGQIDKMNDFGYKILDADQVAVTGTVWQDDDADGSIDLTELLRADSITIKVYEDVNTNGIIDNDEPYTFYETMTDENGEYQVFLPYSSPVTYLIEVDETRLLGGLTTNSLLSAAFTSGSTVMGDKNFGYFANPTSKYISGTVFNDNNQDTSFNAEDLGKEGIKVYLYRDIDGDGILDPGETTAIDSVITDSRGFYEFEETHACLADTVTKRVWQASDDAREQVSNGDVKDDQNDMRLTDGGSFIDAARFDTLNIPQGVEITEAYIQFTASKDGDVNGVVTIKAEKTTNSSTFLHGTDYNISSRTLTDSGVVWNTVEANWLQDQATLVERTVDFKGVVQEVTDQSGWAYGNAMSFIFTAPVGMTKAYTFDNDPTKAPLIFITYNYLCNDNFIVKINESDLPSGAELSTDNYEAAYLPSGGLSDLDNNFGYKFPGSLSGTIYNDNDGLNNSTVDGTGENNLDGSLLYANLINSSGDVLFKTAIENDGTYDFINIPAGNYTVVLSQTEGTIGLDAPSATIPTDWVFTGENLGAGAGNDGTANGTLTGITISTGAVTNANLAVNKKPTTDNGSLTAQLNPGGTTSVTIASTNFGGSDVDGGVIDSIRITSFPTNATSITINGTTYTSGTFPGGGVYTPTNTSGEPTTAIQLDPVDGSKTSVISYAAIDDAGLEDASPATVSVPFMLGISGTLYNDLDGLNNSTVDGTGIDDPDATALYANLVNASDVVLATTAIASDGTYSFADLDESTTYKVIIDDAAATISSTLTSGSLPTDWVFTGDNIGAGTGNDGTADGVVEVAISTTNVAEVNVGINKRPTTDNGSLTAQLNPGGTTSVTIASTNFGGSDVDGGVIDSIRITSFPTNATSITINGTTYTSGTFPGGGVYTPTNTSGEPTTAIQLDPVDGSKTTSISYAAIDDAGLEDASPATVSVPFMLGISGTLYNDLDGLNNSTVDGTGIDDPDATALYANLVNASDVVLATTAIASDGTYSFADLDESTTYKVIIDDAAATISSTLTSGSLPTDWVFTGDNIGAGTGNDGTADGVVEVAISTTNVAEVNVGINKRPTTDNGSLTAQLNPGGTTSVTIASTNFGGSDVDGGVIDSIRITSFPTNATSITINGTTYTSGTFPGGGVYTPTNTSGEPTTAIQLDPVDGSKTSVISYAAIDDAGLEDASPATVSVPFMLGISGTLYNDLDGLNNSTVDGTGIDDPDATALYANLVNASDVVLATTAIASDGTYSFADLDESTTYKVIIDDAAATISSTLTSGSLPTDWVFTGDNIGAGTGNDGTADGVLTVAISTTNVAEVNVGINKRPTTDNGSLTAQLNPGGTTSVTIASTNFGGSDVDGGVIDSIRITSFPTNATSITINGTTYTSGTFPGGGVYTPTNTSGEPTTAIQIDPVDGSKTTSISYAAIDDAGLEDASPATVSVPFMLGISGTLYNDLDGLNNSTVDGTGIDDPDATALYANLVNASDVVLATTAIASDGTYSFADLDESTTYKVIIDDAAATISSTLTSGSLPTDWVFTGDNIGAGTGNDGTADGVVEVAISTTNVAEVNVGINKRPTTDNGSLTAQLNPGGTTSVTIASTNFGGSDVDGGVIDSIRITSFPTNATSITINGTTYTSGTFPGAGVYTPTNTSGEPTTAIQLDPVDGSKTTVISYVAIDDAGLEDASPATVSVPFMLGISGTLYNDLDGLNNSTVDGTGIDDPDATALYANLVNASDVVLATTAIASDGTYSFADLDESTTYKVIIDDAAATISSTLTSGSLPTDWVFTGDNIGAGTGNDGTADGVVEVAISTTNVAEVNVGINKRPTTDNGSLTAQLNPGGTTSVTIASTNFGGSDVDGGVIDSIRITSFPTNATSITINGMTYTSGTFPGGGVYTPTNTSGEPTTAIQLDPVDGSKTTVISYVAIDDAGLEDASPATVSVPFMLGISGTLYNDLDGLNNSTVDGTGIDDPDATALYANLVNASDVVLATTAIASDGTYSFADLDESTTYKVIIDDAAATISSTLTSGSLPTDWVFTGDNIGAGSGNDGTADGVITVAISTTNVAEVNVGINKRPTTDNGSLTAQLNPGGTTSVTIASTNFGGSDVDGGVIDSIRITSFPTNATSITINGTTYTSGTFPGGGVYTPTNTSGEPTTAIQLDPVDGSKTSVISYAAIDDAGLEDASPATVSVPFMLGISGTLYNDLDGLNNSTVDGTGIDDPDATALYANLVNASDVVLATTAIASDGTYSFADLDESTTYKVIIDDAAATISSTLTSGSLPTDWVFTGDNIGAGTGNDGTADGVVEVAISTTNVAEVNVGINKKPTTDNGSLTAQLNPGGTTSVTIASTNFGGSDVDGGVIDSIRITSFPTNATSITINGTTYTSGTFPGAGVTTVTNSSGEPTTAIQIDPVDGIITSIISYAAIDDAGLEDASPATVSVPFMLGITGTVFSDLNGLENSTVDGIGVDDADGTALYANLVNTSDVVLATTAIASDGTYSFTGLDENTTYKVIIDDAAATISSTLTSGDVPTNWVFTGDNIGAGTGDDGTADGVITVAITGSAIDEVNFGINKRPTSAVSLIEDVLDKGGYSFYTPAASVFKTSTGTTGNANTADFQGGSVENIRITSFPTNTNAITINTTTYTNGGTCPVGLTCSAWPGGGVVIPTSAGEPDWIIKVDPIAVGDTTRILFVAEDNGGYEDLTEGKVDILFIFNSTLAVNDVNTTEVNKAVSGDVTTNDFDPEFDVQTFGSFLSPYFTGATISSGATIFGLDENNDTVANAGTLTFDSDGEYTYTPATNFTGTVKVPYSICDDGTPSTCDTAVLVINVEAIPEINDVTKNTVLANDDEAVSFGETINSDAIINDGDAENNTIAISSFLYDSNGDGTPNASGTLASATNIGGINQDGNPVTNAGSFTLNSNGGYTFNPTDDFIGDVYVDYTVCDDVANPNTACEDATIHIRVYNSNGTDNDPPFAGDDYSVTKKNKAVNGNWINNDYEENSEDIRINGIATDIDPASPSASTTILTTLTTQQGGTLAIRENGTYLYTPPSGYTGPDQVRYEICDVTVNTPQPLCDSATIYLLVTSTNKTLAIDDDNSTYVDINVTGDVTTNDFDPEGNTQTFGSFLNQDLSGSPISSGSQVSGVDTAGSPVANAGTLTFNSDGEYTYAPASGFIGSVTVPYNICDNGTPAACDTANLVIIVKPLMDPTVPSDNSIFANDDDIVSYGNTVSSKALTNDADPQGDAIAITSYIYDTDGNGTLDATGTLGSGVTIGGLNEDGDEVANAGSLTLNANGDYSFTPNTGFVGIAKVQYTLCDDVASPNKACQNAFINIMVYGDNGTSNDPPLAGDDFASTGMNVPVTAEWIQNDLDYNGDDVRINGVATDIDPTNPTGTTLLTTVSTLKGGSVKFYTNGTFEYTPPTDYIGPDKVSYEICDVTAVNPQPLCDSATIYLMVDPIVRDYGDLPDGTYGDAWNIFKDANNDGIPEGNLPIWLGTSVTNEVGTQGSAAANLDVDDGLLFPAVLDTTQLNIFKVIVNSTVASTDVYFKLYIDWDQDGTFDSTYTGYGTASSPDTVDVPVAVPSGEDGAFYARLRVALDSNDIQPTGGINNGETEDYTGAFTPVPVELIFFDAEKADDKSLLTWATASEESNSHFEIQRSGSTKKWEAIGEVKGAGNSAEIIDYRFIDEKPLSGTNYYRLKQIDFNGEFEYSETRAVEFNLLSNSRVYPNPARNTVNVSVDDRVIGDVAIDISDMWGRKVLSQTKNNNANSSSNYTLDVSGLRSGTYIVTVTSKNYTKTIKLVVEN